MIITETRNTIGALEEISFDGVIYLVNIKTNKPGNHYISGFHSEVQARKYQSFLNGLDFDKSFVIITTTEEVVHHLTISCTITSITPVNEYIVQKTDAIYSIRPELTSKDLLVLVNDLLAPKQVEQVTNTTQTQPRYQSSINLQCSTGELVKELQRFCDANSRPNITVKVTNLPSDNLGYGIEIRLYNHDTQLSKIIYLTRYDLGVVITPKFEKKVPDSITWKMFGWQHRETYIAATIEVFSKSIR